MGREERLEKVVSVVSPPVIDEVEGGTSGGGGPVPELL